MHAVEEIMGEIERYCAKHTLAEVGRADAFILMCAISVKVHVSCVGER
jgi:hypothetical protein